MAGSDIQQQKSAFRSQAAGNRRDQPDKEELSRRIVGAFMSLPEFALADTVLFYVDVRDEVRTQTDLQLALDCSKTIVVPWCNEAGELELFCLTSMDQLETGKYKIPEPNRELRTRPEHQIDVKALDLLMVPGVCFDYHGVRIGHGKGYYDKLLARARPDAARIAMAFECQVFERIPTAEHDELMDTIVTEQRIYQSDRLKVTR